MTENDSLDVQKFMEAMASEREQINDEWEQTRYETEESLGSRGNSLSSTVPLTGLANLRYAEMSLEEQMAVQGYSSLTDEDLAGMSQVSRDSIAERLRMTAEGGPTILDKVWYGAHKGFWGSIPAAIGTGLYSIGAMNAYDAGSDESALDSVKRNYGEAMDRNMDNLIRKFPGLAGWSDIDGEFNTTTAVELLTSVFMDSYGFVLPLAPGKLMKGKKAADAFAAYGIGAAGVGLETTLANLQWQYLRRAEQGAEQYGSITELDLDELSKWAGGGIALGLGVTKLGRIGARQAAKRSLGKGLSGDDISAGIADLEAGPEQIIRNEDGRRIFQDAEDAVAARETGFGGDVEQFRQARSQEAKQGAGFWEDVEAPGGSVGHVRQAREEAAALEAGYAGQGIGPTGRIPVDAIPPEVGPTGAVGAIADAQKQADDIALAGSRSPYVSPTPYVKPGGIGQINHAADEAAQLARGYPDVGAGGTPYRAMEDMSKQQRLGQHFAEDADITGQVPGRILADDTAATTKRWFQNDPQLVAETGRRLDGMRTALKAQIEAGNHDEAAELWNKTVGDAMETERSKAAFVHLVKDSNSAEDFQKYLTNSELQRLYKNLGSPSGSFLSKGSYDYEMGNWNRLPAGDYELLTANGGQHYNVRKANRRGKWELYRNEGGPSAGPRIGQYNTLKAARAAAEADLTNGFDVKVVSKANLGENAKRSKWGVYDAENGELVGLFNTKKQAIKKKDELAKNIRAGKNKYEDGFMSPPMYAPVIGGAAGAVLNADHAEDWEGMLRGGLAGATLGMLGAGLWGKVASNKAQRLVDSGYVDSRYAKLMEQGMSADEATEAIFRRRSLDNASTFEEMVYSLSDYTMGTINLMRNRMGPWGREFGDKMLNAYTESNRYTGMALHKWNKHGRSVAAKYGIKAHSMLGDTKEYAELKNVAQKIMRKTPLDASIPAWQRKAGAELAAGWSKLLDNVLSDSVARGFYTADEAAGLRSWVKDNGYLPRIWDSAYLQSKKGRDRFAQVLVDQGSMPEMGARNIMMNILDGDEARLAQVMRYMVDEKDGTVRFSKRAAEELINVRNYVSANVNPAKNRFIEKKRKLLFKDEIFEEFIISDPEKIAAQYFESVGNRFAFANQFGKNGEQATRLAGLISEVEGPEFGQNALEMYRRAVNDIKSETVQAKFMMNGKGGSPAMRAMMDSLDAFETMKLGFAQVLNLTQALAYSATMHVSREGFQGLGYFMSDLADMMKKMGTGELQEVVEMSGAALGTTLRQYATEQSMVSTSIGGLRWTHKAGDGVGTHALKAAGNFFTDPNAFLRGTGFLQAEELNRKLGANLGFMQAERMQRQVMKIKKSGKKVPYWMQKQADDLGLDVRFADQWTNDDFLNAALRWSDIVNFTNRSGDLPMWWQTHDPLTRMMRKFKTFGFHSAVFLKDNIFYPLMTGKVDPNDPIANSHLFSKGRNVNRIKAGLGGMTYAGAAATILGVPASYVRDMMRTGEFDPDNLDMMERWLKGAMSIGGAGIFFDMLLSDTKLRDMAGPAIGDIISILDNAAEPGKAAKSIVNYPDYIEEAVFGD